VKLIKKVIIGSGWENGNSIIGRHGWGLNMLWNFAFVNIMQCKRYSNKSIHNMYHLKYYILVFVRMNQIDSKITDV
jgi:hypothetical protein